MSAQEERLRILGLEVLFDEGGPQSPARPKLGNLHVEVHSDTPEK